MQNFWSCLKIFGWSLELFRNLRNGLGDIWKCSQNDYLQLPLEGIEGTLTALKTQCTSLTADKLWKSLFQFLQVYLQLRTCVALLR